MAGTRVTQRLTALSAATSLFCVGALVSVGVCGRGPGGPDRGDERIPECGEQRGRLGDQADDPRLGFQYADEGLTTNGCCCRLTVRS